MLRQKKPSKVANKVSNRCLSLDIYGLPVSLTFQGSDKFRTLSGTALTILLFLSLLGFGVSNIAKIGSLNPPIQTRQHEESFYKINSDLDPEEILRPGKIFAMGLGQDPISPTIGRFVVTQTFKNQSDPAKSSSEELPVSLC